MLLHDSPEGTSPGSAGPPSRNAPGPIVVLIVAALLAVGVYIVTSRSGSRTSGGPAAPNGSPTINNEGGSPPPSIFEVKPGTPIAPVDKEWAVCANPSYEYWFEYPTAWTLSIPQEYTPQGAARMLQAPRAQSAAIIVVPFGLYGSNRDAEIGKAEFTYLGDHSIDPNTDKKIQVNGLEALHREYTCRVKTAAGFDTRKAIAVIVLGKTMGYAIFLRGDEADLKPVGAVYDKLVNSFKVEKLPLRASGVAPPASGAPASRAPASGVSASSAPPSGAPSSAASPGGVPASTAPAEGAPSSGLPGSAAPIGGASPVPAAPSSGHP